MHGYEDWEGEIVSGIIQLVGQASGKQVYMLRRVGFVFYSDILQTQQFLFINLWRNSKCSFTRACFNFTGQNTNRTQP